MCRITCRGSDRGSGRPGPTRNIRKKILSRPDLNRGISNTSWPDPTRPAGFRKPPDPCGPDRDPRKTLVFSFFWEDRATMQISLACCERVGASPSGATSGGRHKKKYPSSPGSADSCGQTRCRHFIFFRYVFLIKI